MKKALFITLVVLLLIAFGVSAFMVGSYILESREQAKLREELSNMVSTEASTAPETNPAETTVPETTEATQPVETTVATEPTQPSMIPQYEEVFRKNPDTVGWIRMEGTKMDNPVMQTPHDPNYYLKRDFNGNASEWGTVYAWSAADINEPSDNITLFGHNMRDGSMFAALNAYTNKSAWEKNSLIFFDTLTEYHTYKIFAVFKTSANLGEGFNYHEFVDAADEQEFNDFISTCKALSFYETGITPVYGDKIICLSTCEYTLDNGRLVVCGVRIT